VIHRLRGLKDAVIAAEILSSASDSSGSLDPPTQSHRRRAERIRQTMQKDGEDELRTFDTTGD